MRFSSLNVIVIFASLSATAAVALSTHPPLKTNFLEKGVTLSIVSSEPSATPDEPFEHLRLGGIPHPIILSTLGDIDGHAAINSKSAALDFVRLRTSPSTWYLWHHGRTLEVVDRVHLSSIPTFGLPSYASGSSTSGYMGVISTSEFAAGGFSAPKVEAHRSEFIVTRWLLAENLEKADGYSVEHVRETIGPKGAYTCHVISTRVAHSGWNMPYYE